MLNAAAVVIGIDKYDRPGVPVLPGCVNDALAATNWLISIGVPPERISVHIGPDKPPPPFPIPVKPADNRTIRSALYALKHGSGDQLFIFVSGHGKYVAGAGPVFCCGDYLVAEGDTSDNLKIAEFIEWFRSFNYRDQFLFYDACQDDAASLGQISPLQAMGPGDPVGTYRAIETNAFTTCYACSPGQTAWAGDGRGVLIRHVIQNLDGSRWQDLDPDAPEQDSIDYDWATGERVIDICKLFRYNIAQQISREAASVGKYQTPFCQPLGRALVDDASPILKLQSLPTTSVTVQVEPQAVAGDVLSIKLTSQVLPTACLLPLKQYPLTMPATLMFPLNDQVRAVCRLTAGSKWKPVKTPIIEHLATPKINIIFQFREPIHPSVNDRRSEFNIVVDGGSGALPNVVTKQLRQAHRDLLEEDIEPNTYFDFSGMRAPEIAGYLADVECVTIASLSSDTPPRQTSLSDLEQNPLDWFEPSHCRITIDLPWGRWTSRFRVGARGTISRVTLPRHVGLEPLRNRYRRGDPLVPQPLSLDGARDGLARQAVGLSDGRRRWGLVASPIPILALSTDSELRVEPFSETTLPEWDQLLTVGRLDIEDAASLVRSLDGELPGGTAEDFKLFSLAAAYAELSNHNWDGLEEIIELVGRGDGHLMDFDLLRIALEIGTGRLLDDDLGESLARVISPQYPDHEVRLPLLRWGVALLVDLAQRANRPLPLWGSAVVSSSAITLIDETGMAALGLAHLRAYSPAQSEDFARSPRPVVLEPLGLQLPDSAATTTREAKTLWKADEPRESDDSQAAPN